MFVKLSLKIPDPTPCVEKNEVILRHYSGWTLCRRPKDSAEPRGGRENCHYESLDQMKPYTSYTALKWWYKKKTRVDFILHILHPFLEHQPWMSMIFSFGKPMGFSTSLSQAVRRSWEHLWKVFIKTWLRIKPIDDDDDDDDDEEIWLGIDWLYMFEKYLFLSISINFSNYLWTHLSPSISLSIYLAISIYAYLSTFWSICVFICLSIHVSYLSTYLIIGTWNPQFWWNWGEGTPSKDAEGWLPDNCPADLLCQCDTDAKILGDRPSIHQYLQSVMNIPDPRFSIDQHSPTIPTIIETDLNLHKLFPEAEATTKVTKA